MLLKYKLIFATNNQHKIDEIQPLLGKDFNLITLAEAGINIDIPEPHDSLEKNAIEKATTIFNITQHNCFAEDTGLEVTALNGEPGVKSARYAGDSRSSDKNIEKLLHKLEDFSDRSARFRTVIALIWNTQTYVFEGICNGTILTQPSGSNGFGYDAIFIPTGASYSFAQMPLIEKNTWSHRRKAVDKLTTFLKQHINKA